MRSGRLAPSTEIRLRGLRSTLRRPARRCGLLRLVVPPVGLPETQPGQRLTVAPHGLASGPPCSSGTMPRSRPRPTRPRSASWQAERDAGAALVTLARTFAGETSAEGLVLKRGEALFATVCVGEPDRGARVGRTLAERIAGRVHPHRLARRPHGALPRRRQPGALRPGHAGAHRHRHRHRLRDRPAGGVHRAGPDPGVPLRQAARLPAGRRSRRRCRSRTARSRRPSTTGRRSTAGSASASSWRWRTTGATSLRWSTSSPSSWPRSRPASRARRPRSAREAGAPQPRRSAGPRQPAQISSTTPKGQAPDNQP